MRRLLWCWIVCLGVMRAGAAGATPEEEADAQYQRATDLDSRGEHRQALVAIADGLSIAPKHLKLLLLKGVVLIRLRDYSSARTAYQAYLDADVTGEERRQAQKIIESLQVVTSTNLEVTLTNGPADVYLDSKSLGLFCTAAPSCSQPLLPGGYKVIVERLGFVPWTRSIAVPGSTTTKLAVALAEKPSLLTVRASPSGAAITVDGAAYDPANPLPSGSHRVSVTAAGHRPARREITARGGQPIELVVTLVRLVPIHVEPAGAKLILDGKPVPLEDGGLEIPHKARTIVVRALGFVDRRVAIPAGRGPDYAIMVEPPRRSFWFHRGKLALAAAGVGLVSLGAGAWFGRSEGQLESISSPLGYTVGGFALAVAFGIAVGGEIELPPARVKVAPRLGRDAGVELAIRF